VSLRELLTVRPGPNGALVAQPAGQGFLFGGLTMGLALRAAAHSVGPAMVPKSFHTYFLRPGMWGSQTTMEVDEESNGRTFCARTVRLRQENRTVAVMTASFHVPGSGSDWQVPPPVDVPGPDLLPQTDVRLPQPDLFEVRSVDLGLDEWTTGRGHPYWARSAHPLGEDPISHDAALAFMSDYLVIYSLLAAGAPIANPSTIRTVDHSVWFHRPVNADDWLLFSSDPVSIAGGRGLAQGSVHARTGTRLASFSQEVIIPA
jgi:acyl-CoA thioesterase II